LNTASLVLYGKSTPCASVSAVDPLSPFCPQFPRLPTAGFRLFTVNSRHFQLQSIPKIARHGCFSFIARYAIIFLIYKFFIFYLYSARYHRRYFGMSFSEKLYILRSRTNLSQSALAEGLNVSRQTISKWELGVSYPEIDKLVAISDFFHVTTDYLLKDDTLAGTPANLDRLVLEFLGSAQDMEQISDDLVEIMRDGIIDESEMIRMQSIVHTLDNISRIIENIKRGLCSGIQEI